MIRSRRDRRRKCLVYLFDREVCVSVDRWAANLQLVVRLGQSFVRMRYRKFSLIQIVRIRHGHGTYFRLAFLETGLQNPPLQNGVSSEPRNPVAASVRNPLKTPLTLQPTRSTP